MKTLILSDLHLGSKHTATVLLREALNQTPFDRLILNGDTLHSVNLKKLDSDHWNVIDLLRRLARSRELILIRGNHDHKADDFPNDKEQAISSRSVLPA